MVYINVKQRPTLTLSRPNWKILKPKELIPQPKTEPYPNVLIPKRVKSAKIYKPLACLVKTRAQKARNLLNDSFRC